MHRTSTAQSALHIPNGRMPCKKCKSGTMHYRTAEINSSKLAKEYFLAYYYCCDTCRTNYYPIEARVYNQFPQQPSKIKQPNPADAPHFTADNAENATAPCPCCTTALEVRRHSEITPKQLSQSCYYKWWLYCNHCNRIWQPAKACVKNPVAVQEANGKLLNQPAIRVQRGEGVVAVVEGTLTLNQFRSMLRGLVLDVNRPAVAGQPILRDDSAVAPLRSLVCACARCGKVMQFRERKVWSDKVLADKERKQVYAFWHVCKCGNTQLYSEAAVWVNLLGAGA